MTGVMGEGITSRKNAGAAMNRQHHGVGKARHTAPLLVMIGGIVSSKKNTRAAAMKGVLESRVDEGKAIGKAVEKVGRCALVAMTKGITRGVGRAIGKRWDEMETVGKKNGWCVFAVTAAVPAVKTGGRKQSRGDMMLTKTMMIVGMELIVGTELMIVGMELKIADDLRNIMTKIVDHVKKI